MRVDELPVPPQVRGILKKQGYEVLYPPQEEAIKAGALEGKNIVLASPTASGKTLVAELCMLKDILERNGRALYLTPLRALASEKYEEFQKYASTRKEDGQPVKIAITSGDYDTADPHLAKMDLIIGTNEKVDSLLRHKASWMSDISTIVADEVHLLTEADRGPTLEVVLTRLMQLNPRAQFLALSATISNASEVAEWLKAVPITTEWRPVPLNEGVFYDGEIQFKDGSSRSIPGLVRDPILDIALEVVRYDGQVLIFTETRRAAVEMGEKAGAALKRLSSRVNQRSLRAVANRILSEGERTRLSEALAGQVARGAGFHHAGLGHIHRRIVEDAFRAGRIKILAATPTLAAGVNLPARTVIVSSYERYEPGYGRYPISVLEYKQFAGRAGRPRYDRFGETILMARTADEQDHLMKNYVLGEPERLWSKLGIERVLRPHVLATIATGFAYTENGLQEFFSRTFYGYQYGPRPIRSKLGEILTYLAEEGMVTYEGSELRATEFGRRVSELYIDPVSAAIIRDGLYRRAGHITELSFLHLISRTPDMAPRLYPRKADAEKLDLLAKEHRDEFMCEVPDYYGEDSGISYEEFLAELKCAKVLMDWIDEASEDQILSVHRVEPGDLLRLVETADWLLYASHELAGLLGHKDLRRQLREVRARVIYGVRRDLLSLVELEGIGRVRARILYNAGYRNLDDLKGATATELMNIPTIGPKLAKRIKEQAGGIIKAEEWEFLKKAEEPAEEQRLLTEY